MNSISADDLLLYLYKESDPELTAKIENALQTDWALRECLNDLAVLAGQLDAVQYSPSQQTLDKIFQYAEKSIKEVTTQG